MAYVLFSLFTSYSYSDFFDWGILSMSCAPLYCDVYFAPRQPAWENIFPPISKTVSALPWMGGTALTE